jgi:hypothetical protein
MVLVTVQLAANASIPPLVIPDGLRAVNGLYLSTTGAVEGSVWSADDPPDSGRGSSSPCPAPRRCWGRCDR